LRPWRIAAVACALWIAACSDDSRPRGQLSTGGSSNGGSSAVAGRAGSQQSGFAGEPSSEAGAGSDGAGQAGEAGEAGAAGAPSNPGAGGYGGEVAGEPPLALDPCPSDTPGPTPSLGSLCDEASTWGTPTALSLPGSGEENLLAITPDELTLVWSAAIGPTLSVFVADRATRDAAFTTATQIYDSIVLGLAPDGLSLVATSDSSNSLYERRRPNRTADFDELAEGPFELLNDRAETQVGSFGNATLSPDGLTLYYTFVSPGDPYPVHVSTRASVSATWPVGTTLQACELQAYGSRAQTPSGVSADGLTLFYDDDARGRARAAYRATTSSAFSHFVDLGAWRSPQPTLGCDRIYFSNRVQPGIFVAPRAP
jgi:hypothetical protein